MHRNGRFEYVFSSGEVSKLAKGGIEPDSAFMAAMVGQRQNVFRLVL